VRKKFTWFGSSSLQQACLHANSLSPHQTAASDALQWEVHQREVSLRCDLPIRPGRVWDIYPHGAPKFILQKATKIVQREGTAQALAIELKDGPISSGLLFPSIEGKEDSIIGDIVDLCTLERGVTFSRMQHDGIRLRCDGAIATATLQRLAELCQCYRSAFEMAHVSLKLPSPEVGS
jgi:hypothetical protein